MGKNYILSRLQELASLITDLRQDDPEVNDGQRYSTACIIINELASNPAVKIFNEIAGQEPTPDFPPAIDIVESIIERKELNKKEQLDWNNYNNEEEFTLWWTTAKAKFAYLMWVRETLVKNRKQMEKQVASLKK
jgi:hypothetical protein